MSLTKTLAPLALTSPPPPQFSDSDLPTVDAVIEEKRRQTRAAAPEHPPQPAPVEQTATTEQEAEHEVGPESPEALEEEASQEGAFNPETGEINWDCPCLGGMAHGPCGEEFKAAFSCFVYSTEEPKGMECIDKFQYVPFEELFLDILKRLVALKDRLLTFLFPAGTCATASGNTPRFTAPS